MVAKENFGSGRMSNHEGSIPFTRSKFNLPALLILDCASHSESQVHWPLGNFPVLTNFLKDEFPRLGVIFADECSGD
jgi:hypothetical protein